MLTASSEIRLRGHRHKVKLQKEKVENGGTLGPKLREQKTLDFDINQAIDRICHQNIKDEAPQPLTQGPSHVEACGLRPAEHRLSDAQPFHRGSKSQPCSCQLRASCEARLASPAQRVKMGAGGQEWATGSGQTQPARKNDGYQ